MRFRQQMRSLSYLSITVTGLYMWVLVAVPIGKAAYAWLLPHLGYLALPAAGVVVFSIGVLATAGAPFYALWIGFEHHHWTPSVLMLFGIVTSLGLLALGDRVHRGERS